MVCKTEKKDFVRETSPLKSFSSVTLWNGKSLGVYEGRVEEIFKREEDDDDANDVGPSDFPIRMIREADVLGCSWV